ncbi:MAG: hypothetical protein AAGJ11_14740 [Bacteroidota bacterium]
MRTLFLLATLVFATLPAEAQFVSSGETDDVRYWGLHLDTNNLPAVFDRFTGISYDDGGAGVLVFDSPLPTLLGGLVYLAVSGDTEARERTSDTFVTLLGDASTGCTFVPTPVGEAGLGLDVGGAGMTTPNSGTDLDLVVYTGPNVLFTARPVENLHLVGHASYNVMYSLGNGAANGWGNRLIEVDVQATWPLSESFAIYGGVFHRNWTFPQSQAEGAPDETFSTVSVSAGIKISSGYLFFL